MESKQRSIGRNMMFNSVGSLFYLVCQWLLTVLVVPLGSFEKAGYLTLAISLTNFFFTVAYFGLRNFQVSDSVGKYSPSLYISTRILTCIAAFGLCVAFTLCNWQYSGEQMACIIFYMVFRVAEALVDVLAGEEQKAYRFDYVGLSFILRGVVMLGSFTLTLYLTRQLPLTLLIMGLATLAVALVYDWPRVRKLTGFRVHLSCRESLPLLQEVWPMMVNAALLTLLAAVPRYFLERYAGSEALGYFGSISTPAVIIQAGCSFIYTPLVAPLTERFTEARWSDFKKMVLTALAGILGFAVCMFIGAALLGRWGLSLLFGEAILPYAYLLVPVLGTTLCISLIYFFDVLLTIGRRLKIMTVIHLAAVALAVASSMICIPTYGMNGVVAVLYLCAGGDMLAMALAAAKMYRDKAKGTK